MWWAYPTDKKSSFGKLNSLIAVETASLMPGIWKNV
jgi:hypothetical protein